jgi:hypothetical protein
MNAYSRTALPNFEQITEDIIVLARLADSLDATASALERIENSSRDAIAARRWEAARIRRAIRLLDWCAGKADRLHLLNNPVEIRTNRYGGNNR